MSETRKTDEEIRERLRRQTEIAEECRAVGFSVDTLTILEAKIVELKWVLGE